MMINFEQMKRILIVEDNIMMRKLITNLFKGREIEYTEASNGLEALNLVKKSKFDLVITDIFMPVMEGMELIGLLKKDDPALKIIAISGSQPFYLYMAKKLGINGVFTKPLNKTQFLKHVNKLLGMQEDL